MRKRRVVGRVYGMKYSWKGHKHRNRHKDRIKTSGQTRLVYGKKNEPQHSHHVKVSPRGKMEQVKHGGSCVDRLAYRGWDEVKWVKYRSTSSPGWTVQQLLLMSLLLSPSPPLWLTGLRASTNCHHRHHYRHHHHHHYHHSTISTFIIIIINTINIIVVGFLVSSSKIHCHDSVIVIIVQ